MLYIHARTQTALIFVMYVISLMVFGSNDQGGELSQSDRLLTYAFTKVPAIHWHIVSNKGVKNVWLYALNSFVMIAQLLLKLCL